jgi:hypothetical protein
MANPKLRSELNVKGQRNDGRESRFHAPFLDLPHGDRIQRNGIFAGENRGMMQGEIRL